jgi:type IV secretion system protein VirB1
VLGLALIIAACGVNREAALLLERIVRVESGGVPYALNVNGAYELVRQPRGNTEALAMARWLLVHGHNFDAGLAQVNSANFERLGLTVETALEPCANLRAAERLLNECQSRALQRYGAGERAEAAALSCYNTGDFTRGLVNSYVAAVQNAGDDAPRPGSRRIGHPDARVGRPRATHGPGIASMGLRAKDVFAQGSGT